MKETKLADLVQRFQQDITTFEPTTRVANVGTVVEISDGVARIEGLSDVMYNEVITFASGVHGVTLGLEEDDVRAVVLGDYVSIRQNDLAVSTGHILSVSVGPGLIGRVVDALGRPRDGHGRLQQVTYLPVERPAPSIIERAPVTVPLQTGILAIDAMIPIGRGQRELIIGDRQTGKTTLAVDTILNQHRGDVVCVYVAIGQKLASVAQVVDTLKEHGAMDYTVIVAASASDPAALQYVAPYAGCSIGEYFMEQGRDVLVVFDDLTKHAWSYRQISLLLRRPPGREAYPGDVFYLHSRLLERAANLNKERGGGSLTALPIVETQLGDIAAYIPTNIISITDGQIYLEADLFHAGVRPALNVGLSVSRVGGAAQTKAMRQVAGKMRLDLAQYRELAAFAQFGSDLDSSTQALLQRGRRTTEILKQSQHAPQALHQQVMSIYLVTRGHLDQLPIEEIHDFQEQFEHYMATVHPKVGEGIDHEEQLTDELEQQLLSGIAQFKETVWRGS